MNTYTKPEVDALLFTSSSQVFSDISLINLELELNYRTATQLADTYYDKTENDNLLASKVSTTGNVVLSGNLYPANRFNRK